MKVFDVVLAWIRALVVLDLIREVSSICYLSLRGLALLPMWRYAGTRADVLTSFGSPLIGIVVSFLILAASRPIARFAAKFAGSIDAASQF